MKDNQQNQILNKNSVSHSYRSQVPKSNAFNAPPSRTITQSQYIQNHNSQAFQQQNHPIHSQSKNFSSHRKTESMNTPHNVLSSQIENMDNAGVVDRNLINNGSNNNNYSHLIQKGNSQPVGNLGNSSRQLVQNKSDFQIGSENKGNKRVRSTKISKNL